ncbi:MAG: RluA family pseudouridine synthase [Deltaproteobacteria bacterium]|nr:RluA family pseudouridine synthase [Deltaproteobacteria bacterium]
MTTTWNLIADAADEGKRLDVFIAANLPVFTRSGIKRLMEADAVTVNGGPGKPGQRLKFNDMVTVKAALPSSLELQPEDIPLNVVYEDSDVLVINKPAGISVHPGAGRASGTLVNALLHYTKDLALAAGADRPGIVHRLDKDTTGLLVVAKNDAAYASLASQFKAHSTVRRYKALVWGAMRDNEGAIDLPLGRDAGDRKKISTRTKKARSAVTVYRVIKRYPPFTLLELTLKTGRTHQVRAHLAAIKHPVACDPVYGSGRQSAGLPAEVKAAIKKTGRQLLHAETLGFVHPATGAYMEWSAPLPEDMATVIRALEGWKTWKDIDNPRD